MALIKGSSIALLKYLLINKVLVVDISEKLNLNKHLELNAGIMEANGGTEIG